MPWQGIQPVVELVTTPSKNGVKLTKQAMHTVEKPLQRPPGLERSGLLISTRHNRPVRFQTAQDVRANQLAQRCKLVVLTRLQAFHE